MPFRRTYATRRQGTRGGRKPAPRRRTGIKTRVRYQRPTARNQKSQIASVARMAVRNSKILNASKVYTDWAQRSNQDYTPTTSFPVSLVDINGWDVGARSNTVVERERTTFLREMQFNYYVSAPNLQDPLFLSMFLVTIRPNAIGTPIPSPLVPATDPAPPIGAPTPDYTSMGQFNSIILNSSKYKVLWTRFFKLFPAAFGTADEPIGWGNPSTTYRRGRVNMKLNWLIRGVGQRTWRQLETADLPPSRRLYLIIASYSTSPAGNRWTLNWGTKFTCVNDN